MIGEMGSIKRSRDVDYSYEEVHSSFTLQQLGAEGESSAVCSPNNGYVENLLNQARMVGLLPSDGVATSPSSSRGGDRSSFGTGTEHSPLRNEWQGSPQNGSAKKKRKMNIKKPKKKQEQPEQRPDQQNQSNQPKETKPKKPGQKAPGREAVDDSVIQRLIADALANPVRVPALNAIPKFPTIPKPENYPPPLPPIHDEAIEQQCFTHRSFVHDPSQSGVNSTSMHYERLEFLGDSYMNYCVTKILYSRLPDLQEGELTKFRSQIISNDNIRHYAVMYGFHDRLRLSGGAEKDSMGDGGKKIADVFEAYIGGLLTDQPADGERVVFDWMAAIIAPQVDETEKVAQKILSMNKHAKQELYVLLDAERVPAPTYVVTREGGTNTDFEVACLVAGKEMGRGYGKNKADAGNRAAMQVLDRLKESVLRHKEKREQEAAAAAVAVAEEMTVVSTNGIAWDNGEGEFVKSALELELESSGITLDEFSEGEIHLTDEMSD